MKLTRVLFYYVSSQFNKSIMFKLPPIIPWLKVTVQRCLQNAGLEVDWPEGVELDTGGGEVDVVQLLSGSTALDNLNYKL